MYREKWPTGVWLIFSCPQTGFVLGGTPVSEDSSAQALVTLAPPPALVTSPPCLSVFFSGNYFIVRGWLLSLISRTTPAPVRTEGCSATYTVPLGVCGDLSSVKMLCGSEISSAG